MYKVTVLMPVYNGEKYLKESIESILNQTFEDFEFLIINDGSTDKSVEIINTYTDSRIKLINNEVNIGLADTLNKGIEIANSEYIVRMDCDDISLSHRIEKLITYMDKNPNIDFCGSGRVLLGHRDGDIITYTSNPDLAKAKLLFECCFAHPTVVYKRSKFKKYNLKYRKEFIVAQDYDLWSRACKYLKMTNIKEPLLIYRNHEGQLSVKDDVLKKENIRIWKQQLDFFGINPSQEQLELHEKIALHQFELSDEFLNTSEKWLSLLINQNKRTKYYSRKHFNKLISSYWYNICWVNRYLGVETIKMFMNSDISKNKFCSIKNLDLIFSCIRKELKKKK